MTKKLSRANRVKRANNTSSEQLFTDLPDILDSASASFATQVARASELAESDRESIFMLWEMNMKALYMKSTSLHFNPEEKRQELFHSDSRFILYRLLDSQMIAAYTMFRFDFEEDELVLYCYELQVSPDFRRHGLGRSLMSMLLILKQRWSMEKVMLTVFKANEPAVAFYQSTGFTPDPISPEWEDEEDYVIMSHSGTV
ncbi:unnamed protein product [Peniophora sp. CBMAI 1063]|nr:unnamed protein product [Peniophora sp. CBMAI 1063]